MSDEAQNSISVRFLNEVLAERGSQLVVKVVPVGKVLLVEDDPNDVFEVQRLFTSIGLTLVTVTDGMTAIERIKSEQFSLVLLDLKLPGMDGLEVLQVARKAFPELHVVILAGALSPDLTMKAKGLGYFGVCLKPLRRSDVLDILLQHGLVTIGFP